MRLFLSKTPKALQYGLVTLTIALVAIAGNLLYDLTGYRAVALVLLMLVSLFAMFFEIGPVLLAATLSALVWDFFFIPPRYTFIVSTAEDTLLLCMYFVIALLNATLTYKIRQAEIEMLKREEKENAIKLYNTLFNSLSHELRTPIATIVGGTDNLLSEELQVTAEGRKEILNEISIAALRLNRQVQNLLEMSRLESGQIKLKKDWCDVRELVTEVVNGLRKDFSKRVISIQVKESMPLFKLDFVLVEQILHNLTHNALTYTPDYSAITVRAMQFKDNLVLEVEDTGNGFPADEIEHVFDKFYRLKNTAPGGTGLGLSIVKGFTEVMGGTISVENMQSGGARFTVSIPSEVSYITHLKNE